MSDKKNILTLGIESSCDETAIAVLKNGRELLSNVIATQIPIHQKFGGVVPEIASRKHIVNILPVLHQALDEANVSLDDISQIAVTYGPGLVGALLVGVSFAKGLAFAKNLPLIGVHHLEGHIFANFLSEKNLEPPFMALVVSGGHTSLIFVKDYNDFSLMGQTRDDAAGETFDKIARVMGLPYPGGPQIDLLAKKGNPNAITFPTALIKENNFDFSFSGLKSAVINYFHNEEQRRHEINLPDVAASFQKAVIDVLVQKSLRAVRQKKLSTLVLAGGVAANSTLEKNLREECQKQHINFYFPSKILCTDNAAMIACRGYYQSLAGKFSDLNLNAVPNLPLRYERCLE